MKYVEAAGMRVSAIGVGTWQFGSREWGYGGEYAQRTAVEIVHRALDLGVNLIDTAEIYAFGESERIVGSAIRDRRGAAFVATKVFPVMPLAKIVEWRGRLSAARLGIASIDLYQIHWPNPLVPFAQTMAGMKALADAGLVRYVGVSNFSTDQWRAAEAAYGRPVVSNQVEYSLVARGPERAILPHAQHNDRVVIAYSPLAQGLLGGRYDKDHLPVGGIRTMNALFLPENLERMHTLITTLREIATAHEASPSQVALAWVIRRPNVVAIPGASSIAQLEANVAAADLELSDEDDARLSAASAAFHPRTGLPAVPELLWRQLRFRN